VRTEYLLKKKDAWNVVAIAPVGAPEVHPAIQDLLLTAAMRIHSGTDAFHRAGRFPAAERIGLPLSKAAVGFYSGSRSCRTISDLFPCRQGATDVIAASEAKRCPSAQHQWLGFTPWGFFWA
jgi:hypothetical protein